MRVGCASARSPGSGALADSSHTAVLVASGLTGQLTRSRIDLRCGCRRKKRKGEDLHEVSTPNLVRRTDLVWTVRSCALWLIFLPIWSHDLGRNIQRETSRVAPMVLHGDTTTRVSGRVGGETSNSTAIRNDLGGSELAHSSAFVKTRYSTVFYTAQY